MSVHEIVFHTRTDVNDDFAIHMELLVRDYQEGIIGENRFTKISCNLMSLRKDRLQDIITRS